MSKLIKLPSGAWIDPKTITAIRPLTTTVDHENGTQRARVCIDYGSNGMERVQANDDDHALELADHYAELANASR